MSSLPISTQRLTDLINIVDESIEQQLKENLASYPRFVKASDVFEILGMCFVSLSAISAYADVYEQAHLVTGTLSTLSLSCSVLSRYLNKEAIERETRINNILHGLQSTRPPITLGTTESNI
jgi:hypothetical protein